MKTLTIEFGAWEPDAALLSGQQAPEARNVIPARRGYHFFPAQERGRYPALAAQAMEVLTTKDLAGDLQTCAATNGKIYALENGAWVQRYSDTALTKDRYFCRYGNEIFALFGSQLVHQAAWGSAFKPVTTGSGYSYDAPAGTRLGIIRDFLFIGGLTAYPNGVQWSGIDRPDEWPTPGSNQAQYIQADRQIFPVGGTVQSVVGSVGGTDGLIFLERAVQRATYVGPPYIFQFDPVDQQQGTIAPKSPVVCGNACYYLSEDGWKATDGASVNAIGIGRVKDWFFSTCDPDRIAEVRGAHDARNRLAVWSFPTSGAPSGRHNRLLIYSYALDKWSYAQVDVECICGDFSRGMTLEQLDTLDEFSTPDGLDVKAPSLDSAQFKNGMSILGCVDGSHRLGSFTGDAMEAVVDTAEQGGARMMLHGFRPLVDGGDAQAAPRWRILQKYGIHQGNFTSQQRDGVCYQHLSCDYAAARILIPAGAEWKTALAVEVLIEEEGGY